jgi:hypothetical protein
MLAAAANQCCDSINPGRDEGGQLPADNLGSLASWPSRGTRQKGNADAGNENHKRKNGSSQVGQIRVGILASAAIFVHRGAVGRPANSIDEWGPWSGRREEVRCRLHGSSLQSSFN